VERLFAVKGRPHGMPLPLLLGDAQELLRVTDTLTPILAALAEQFWPGPLTLVVPAGALVPALVTARGWTVAVRVPDHPVARDLARRLGGPITGTSANRSGGPDPHTADAVRRQIGRHIDLVIQGGPAPQGRASTVLDITGPAPRLLREGAVPEAAILEACSNLMGPSGLEAPDQG
jgi:L-threonylcarbamoyladenylate synthase